MLYRTVRTVIFAAAIGLALLTAFASTPGTSAQPAPAAPSRVYLPLVTGNAGPQTAEEQAKAGEVLTLLNAERARAGCQPLTIDPKLTLAAQRHSQDMAVNNFVSHIGSTGTNPGQRASSVGYIWSTVGENVAAGYTTAEAVMSGWMTSDSHRQNLLNCAYIHIGIGYTYQADDAPLADAQYPYFHYWTQLLASPR